MNHQNIKKQSIKYYFDYAATTPIDPMVARRLSLYNKSIFGNSMSLHSRGQMAKSILEASRATVASLIKADPEEIVFTGSATESNNLALKGIASANRKRGNHIIITQIEHPCIIETTNWLERQHFKITRLPVNKYGLISLADLKKSIRPDTLLVSVIHASNEIGTIQPIRAIGKLCRARKVYFHTDAAQSFGKIPIDVNKDFIDLLTASAHKMYGPKGAACLYIKQGIKIEPILHGGGQENGLRSSTVNVPAIAGFAEAIKICQKKMGAEAIRLIKLRDGLIRDVLNKIPDSHLLGHPKKRLPNNINFRFDHIEGESIVIQLDLFGIAASTGSACSSAKLEPSHVLLALGLKHKQAHGSLRISLGRWTKKSEIDYLLKVLPEVINKLRKISPYK